MGETVERVVGIYRYPVKGLSPQSLDAATVEPKQTLVHDRAWALEIAPGKFDPAQPKYLAKVNFAMLMRHERLATLTVLFDDKSVTLTLKHGDETLTCSSLETERGRAAIAQAIAAHLGEKFEGRLQVVSANGHSFSDVSAKCLHIVNLESLRELERIAGQAVNPIRFRPNLVVDGVPPWQEFDWVGRQITVGDVSFKVFKRTERCAATNVDPDTGRRDMAIPDLLAKTFGHTDFGIYAEVKQPGVIRIGNTLHLE